MKGATGPTASRVTAGRSVGPLARELTRARSDRVVPAGVGRSAPGRTGSVVPVELMPGDPGEHELTSDIGMRRGRIVVEAA